MIPVLNSQDTLPEIRTRVIKEILKSEKTTAKKGGGQGQNIAINTWS